MKTTNKKRRPLVEIIDDGRERFDKSLICNMDWQEFYEYLLKESEKPYITFEVKSFSKDKGPLKIIASKPALIQMQIYHLIISNKTFLNNYCRGYWESIKNKLNLIAKNNIQRISQICNSFRDDIIRIGSFPLETSYKGKKNVRYIRLDGYNRFIYNISYDKLYIFDVMFHFSDDPQEVVTEDSKEKIILKRCQEIMKSMYDKVEKDFKNNKIKIPNYFDDILK